MPERPAAAGRSPFADLLARYAREPAPDAPAQARTHWLRDTLLAGPPGRRASAGFSGPDDSLDGPDRDPPDELDGIVRGAAQDILLAVHAVTGWRWALLSSQDAFWEGDDSEADAPNPVRLDSYLKAVYREVDRENGPTDDGDLSGKGRVARDALARAALERMSAWEDAHDLHLFGQAIDPAAVLGALSRLDEIHPEPVNYFRRYDIPAGGGVFRPGATVLSGGALDLTVATLEAAPSASETENLYARTDRRYAVPPTAGERAEADAFPR